MVERQRARNVDPLEFRRLAYARPPATLVNATLNLPLKSRNNPTNE